MPADSMTSATRYEVAMFAEPLALPAYSVLPLSPYDQQPGEPRLDPYSEYLAGFVHRARKRYERNTCFS